MPTENKKLEKLKEFFHDSETEWNETNERIKENMRFFVGGDQQWEPDDLAALNEDGKPHLTYNEIMPKVNAIVGEYLNDEQQVNVIPRKGGTKTAANLMTALAKYVSDVSELGYEEAECFIHGIISAIGWMGWKIDYEKDPFNGDLIFENRWPTEIMPDMSSKDYDVNKSCKYIFDSWWWDTEQLIAAYPKKENDIKSGGLLTTENDSFFEVQGIGRPGGEDDYGDKIEQILSSTETMEGRNLRFKTRTCWWKKYKKIPHLWSKSSKFDLVKLKDKKSIDIAKLLVSRDPNNYRIFDRVACTLNKTVQAGYMILEDVEDPFGPRISRFPFTRFCPYWLGGYFMGAIDNAKDPQRQANKSASQALHILNSIARGLWMNKDEEGADPDELEQVSTTVGGVINYKSVKPEQSDPPKLPTGHVSMYASNVEAVGRIMGVREPMQGGEDVRNQSGIAIMRRQIAGTKMALPMFNKFRRTRQWLYEAMVEFIRYTDIFSDDEVQAIVDEEDLLDRRLLDESAKELGPAPQPPQQPDPIAIQALQTLDAKNGTMGAVAVVTEFRRALEQYQKAADNYDDVLKQRAKQKLLDTFKTIEVGKYGVKVDQSKSSPTIRLAIFQMMLEAKKYGINIPDDLIVEASDWPNSDKIVERMRAMPQTVPQAV